jgi:hypothetical protein
MGKPSATKSLSEVIGSILVLFVGVPAMGICGWAAIIFISQFSFWFRYGVWYPVSAKALFIRGPYDLPNQLERFLPDWSHFDFSEWLTFPTQARGPHHLIYAALDWLSAPCFLLLMAGACAWMAMSIWEKVKPTVGANGFRDQ